MGLRNTTQQAALTAFIAIGDIARPTTYQHLTGTVVRNIEEGTSTAEMVTYPLKYTVAAKFKAKEVDGEAVLSTDQKFLFPSLILPIEAKASDTILDERGQTWEIIKLMTDPAEAVVILQVRTSR